MFTQLDQQSAAVNAFDKTGPEHIMNSNDTGDDGMGEFVVPGLAAIHVSEG